MNCTTLDITHTEKDLGIIVDEDLKFHMHIANAVNKASGMKVPRLFTAMVRPHLEYGNVIWHPRYRRDKLEVGEVQRRTTKLIPSISHLPYEDQLKFRKLPSLDFRR